MAIQITGGKMLTLFYGVGIQVWASTIIISMLCLAIGYFVGGNLSEKNNPIKLIQNVLVLACFYTLILGFASNQILESILMDNPTIGSLVAALVIVGPCTFLFGLVGPLVSQHMASKINKSSGQAVGSTFLISTLGGTLFVLVFGLALIPQLGISACFLLIAALLVIASLPILRTK